MKKGFLKKLITITVVGLMTFSLAGCGSSNTSSTSANQETKKASGATLEQLQKKGTIVVGMMAATPPYEFHAVQNGKDQIIGCDIKLIDQVAKDLGVKYEIKDMDFDGLLVALQAGKIDMIVSAMSPTPERAKNADFSNVYYKDKHVIVINKDNHGKINSSSDLDGKTIGVIKSSVQEQIVQKTITKAKTKSLGKSTDLALDLGSKKVDAILVDIPTAKLLSKANDKIELTEIYYNDDTAGAAIAMPKGTDPKVMEIVNKSIDKAKPVFTDWLTEAMGQVQQK